MSRTYTITEQNVAAFDKAIHFIRDEIKGMHYSKEREEEAREVLAGLLSIYPKPEETWRDTGWTAGFRGPVVRTWRGPEGDGAA